MTRISDLAHHLDMPQPTLYTWARRHWVSARQLPEVRKRWVAWANHDEIERLRRLRQYGIERRSDPPPLKLTTLKVPRNQE